MLWQDLTQLGIIPGSVPIGLAIIGFCVGGLARWICHEQRYPASIDAASFHGVLSPAAPK